MRNDKKSFTIIELLVVIAIIGLISSAVLVYTHGQIVKARDIMRISDMKQIQKGLEMYFDRKEKYPDPVIGEGEGPWDLGNVGMPAYDTFIQPLVEEGIFGKVSVETDGKLGVEYGTYRYYRYVPADGICGGMTFYILAAYLENFQSSYGVGDEVSSCYDVFNWQDPHWYTIMGIEQYPAE